MSNIEEVLALTLNSNIQDGVNFKSYDLSGISLNGISFIFSVFTESNFNKAELVDINFSQANLKNTRFKNAKIKNVNFTSANLENANFEDATLINCIFKNAKLEYSNFASAQIKGCQLRGCNLSHGNLSSAKIQNSDLSFARLMYTYAKSIDISGSRLNGINARGSDFGFQPHRSPGSHLKIFRFQLLHVQGSQTLARGNGGMRIEGFLLQRNGNGGNQSGGGRPDLR